MLQISNLTLRHGPLPLLEGANATVFPGHKVGLIGANGTGKSTLFSLLLGRMSVDAGDCSLPADWTIAAMAQEIHELDRVALDYVIDGDERLRAAEASLARAEQDGDGEAIARAHAALDDAGGYTARARAGALLNGLGFKPQEHANPVGAFSGGWRIRLSLARALMCPADLLLLDEPTNHLDMETVIWLEDWLKRFDGTLILISHDRDFLDNVVQSVIHIEHRQLTSYSGGYSDFERQRAERLAQQQARFERQQREVAHMQKFIDRFRAKASKAKAAQSRIKALERMEKVAPAHADSPFDFAFPEPPRASNPLVSLDRVDLGYGDKRILGSLNLGLAPGDRIGLLGLNGAGKSTLVRALAGDLAPLAGRLELARGLTIGYFAQHQVEQLDLQASPLLHLQRLAPEQGEQKLRDFLGGFDFRGDMATSPVGPMSGGEKARLVLAMLVWRAPNLLLLDEPTNHLDLDMRHALTMALQAFEGAVVTVSHDRHLLNNTVDDFWLVAHGGVTRFDGDLDDYRRWLADQGGPNQSDPGLAPANSRSARRDQRRDQAAQRARIKPLKNRVERLTRQIDETGEALADIEQQLADPALYEGDRQDDLARLIQRQQALKSTQDQLEGEWMDAEQALEAALVGHATN
ncbi:MAG: ATP-binding cassette domain-containing protein [Wenzhouxiangella sp.]